MAASSAAVPAPPVWFSFARSSSTEKEKTCATEPDFDRGLHARNFMLVFGLGADLKTLVIRKERHG